MPATLTVQGPITPRQIASAAKEACRLYQELTRLGRTDVTNAELQEARRQATESYRELTRAQEANSWLLVRFVPLAILEGFLTVTGLSQTGCVAPAMAIGVLPFGVTAVLLLLGGATLPWILGMALATFLLTTIPVAIVLKHYDNRLTTEVQGLRTQRDQNRQRLRTLMEWHAGWSKHLRALQIVYDARTRYENALEHHKKLVDTVNSRRYQLKFTDWRSLRSVPFEDFLAEVFELLGFTVTKTKATGDQGADLILTGKGKKIAVQAKGYGESVGNGAVQEVHAGMAYYQCNECVVVTNSYFTESAWTLAAVVGCRLVDGKSMHDLIDGKIY